jgi:hypothetical protein
VGVGPSGLYATNTLPLGFVFGLVAEGALAPAVLLPEEEVADREVVGRDVAGLLPGGDFFTTTSWRCLNRDGERGCGVVGRLAGGEMRWVFVRVGRVGSCVMGVGSRMG